MVCSYCYEINVVRKVRKPSMPYLFQISIGPVQSFITGARRTRDLKFSSSFLSRLARKAASTLAEQCGETSLIFPSMAAGKLDDVPNKILAYIERDIPPATLAQVIKQTIDEEVEAVRDNVFEKIKQGHFDHVRAERQIADLVEYTWAAIEHDDRQATYAISRQRLEAVMAARKNTRDFAPVTWGSGQLKSSIDGQLEGVIDHDEYPRIRNIKAMSDAGKHQVAHQVRELRSNFGAGPHEHLSGVDLLKRLGPIEEGETRFPSTSHMAALPFLAGLHALSREKSQEIARWKEQYIKSLRDIDVSPATRTGQHTPLALDILPEAYREHTYWEDIYSLGEYDGALLYPERFPDVVGDARMFQEVRAQFQAATQLLDDFLRKIGIHPGPYYALLVADGDSMGKMIDAQARENDGMQRHKALSEALARFALRVRELIKGHAGVRIYSGGDDVLAFLPLHKAVECASELAKAFREELKTFTYADGKAPSLSAGLAIVHHLHPLGDALRIARNAEQRAKRDKKNALAITVQKRGGPPCEVGGQWGVFDKRLEQQIELCQSEIIPSGMAYELEEIALRLESEHEVLAAKEEGGARPETASKEKPEMSLPHVRYAALRVFQRKLGEAGGREKSQEQALALYALKRMVGLIGTDEASATPDEAFKALKKTLGVKEEETRILEQLRVQVDAFDQLQPVRVASLADELIVARLFANARRLAGGKSEGGEA
jgi:CRISPR-associated protein Cmr2